MLPKSARLFAATAAVVAAPWLFACGQARTGFPQRLPGELVLTHEVYGPGGSSFPGPLSVALYRDPSGNRLGIGRTVGKNSGVVFRNNLGHTRWVVTKRRTVLMRGRVSDFKDPLFALVENKRDRARFVFGDITGIRDALAKADAIFAADSSVINTWTFIARGKVDFLDSGPTETTRCQASYVRQSTLASPDKNVTTRRLFGDVHVELRAEKMTVAFDEWWYRSQATRIDVGGRPGLLILHYVKWPATSSRTAIVDGKYQIRGERLKRTAAAIGRLLDEGRLVCP